MTITLPSINEYLTLQDIRKFEPESFPDRKALIDMSIVDLSLYIRDVFAFFLISDEDILSRNQPNLVDYGNNKVNWDSPKDKYDEVFYLFSKQADNIKSLIKHFWRSVPVHEVIRNVVGLTSQAYAKVVFFPDDSEKNEPYKAKTKAELFLQYEWYSLIHKCLIAFDLAQAYWSFSSWRTERVVYDPRFPEKIARPFYNKKPSAFQYHHSDLFRELLRKKDISQDIFDFFTNEEELNWTTCRVMSEENDSRYMSGSSVFLHPHLYEGLEGSDVYGELERIQYYINDFQKRVIEKNESFCLMYEMAKFDSFLKENGPLSYYFMYKSCLVLKNYQDDETRPYYSINRLDGFLVDSCIVNSINGKNHRGIPNDGGLVTSSVFKFTSVAFNLLFNLSGYFDVELLKERIENEKDLLAEESGHPSSWKEKTAKIPRINKYSEFNRKTVNNQYLYFVRKNGYINPYFQSKRANNNNLLARSEIYYDHMSMMCTLPRPPVFRFRLVCGETVYHSCDQLISGINASVHPSKEGWALTSVIEKTRVKKDENEESETDDQKFCECHIPPVYEIYSHSKFERINNVATNVLRKYGTPLHKHRHAKSHIDQISTAINFLTNKGLKFVPLHDSISVYATNKEIEC